MDRDIYAKIIAKLREAEGLLSNIPDISGLETDVSGLQTDVSGLQTDVSGLQTDVSGLQTDVSGLQTDVSGMSTTLTPIGNIMKILNNVSANTEIDFPAWGSALMIWSMAGAGSGICAIGADNTELVALENISHTTNTTITTQLSWNNGKLKFENGFIQVILIMLTLA